MIGRLPIYYQIRIKTMTVSMFICERRTPRHWLQTISQLVTALRQHSIWNPAWMASEWCQKPRKLELSILEFACTHKNVRTDGQWPGQFAYHFITNCTYCISRLDFRFEMLSKESIQLFIGLSTWKKMRSTKTRTQDIYIKHLWIWSYAHHHEMISNFAKELQTLRNDQKPYFQKFIPNLDVFPRPSLFSIRITFYIMQSTSNLIQRSLYIPVGCIWRNVEGTGSNQ